MFFKDFVSVKRKKIKKGASQTYDTPSRGDFRKNPSLRLMEDWRFFEKKLKVNGGLVGFRKTLRLREKMVGFRKKSKTGGFSKKSKEKHIKAN